MVQPNNAGCVAARYTIFCDRTLHVGANALLFRMADFISYSSIFLFLWYSLVYCCPVFCF